MIALDPDGTQDGAQEGATLLVSELDLANAGDEPTIVTPGDMRIVRPKDKHRGHAMLSGFRGQEL